MKYNMQVVGVTIWHFWSITFYTMNLVILYFLMHIADECKIYWLFNYNQFFSKEGF